jgi:hypothetical protein
VKWAGDTPVIIVDNIGFPGTAKYSARVMIFGDTYSGTWSAGDHERTDARCHRAGEGRREKAVARAWQSLPVFASDTPTNTTRLSPESRYFWNSSQPNRSGV